MKKTLAILLVLMLTLGACVSGLAEGTIAVQPQDPLQRILAERQVRL